MARIYEEPVSKVEVRSGGRETITTHPAFCQIGASRVSGSTALYDSDFSHNAYMTISICRSELVRGLSYDRHHGKEEIIEVALSESQWATFVSAPNVGGGVPCTLQYLHGKSVPELPTPAKRSDQFGTEILASMNDALADIEGLIAQIDALGLSAKKADALKEGVHSAHRRLRGHIPFVADQFEEHMERIVERSKAEVHGYMTGTLIRSGMTQLASNPPLQIESDPA